MTVTVPTPARGTPAPGRRSAVRGGPPVGHPSSRCRSRSGRRWRRSSPPATRAGVGHGAHAAVDRDGLGGGGGAEVGRVVPTPSLDVHRAVHRHVRLTRPTPDSTRRDSAVPLSWTSPTPERTRVDPQSPSTVTRRPRRRGPGQVRALPGPGSGGCAGRPADRTSPIPIPVPAVVVHGEGEGGAAAFHDVDGVGITAPLGLPLDGGAGVGADDDVVHPASISRATTEFRRLGSRDTAGRVDVGARDGARAARATARTVTAAPTATIAVRSPRDRGPTAPGIGSGAFSRAATATAGRRATAGGWWVDMVVLLQDSR
jgi:hypothetical protein